MWPVRIKELKLISHAEREQGRLVLGFGPSAAICLGETPRDAEGTGERHDGVQKVANKVKTSKHESLGLKSSRSAAGLDEMTRLRLHGNVKTHWNQEWEGETLQLFLIGFSRPARKKKKRHRVTSVRNLRQPLAELQSYRLQAFLNPVEIARWELKHSLRWKSPQDSSCCFQATAAAAFV